MVQKQPNGVTKIKSRQPGPVLAVVSGTHGNELAGPGAVMSLRERLRQIKRGTLFLVQANPRALAKGVRATEQNLNRCFADTAKNRSWHKSYEYRRAQELKIIFDQCDAVLDLHATSIKNSAPFIISAKHADRVTSALPLRIVCTGFDRVEPGGIDHYLNRQGKIGIAVECGYLDDPKAIAIGRRCITAFLNQFGLWDQQLPRPAPRQTKMDAYLLYCNKTDSFKLTRSFNNFDYLKKGAMIGYDGSNKITAPKDSYIIFAHNRDQKGEECFLLARSV